MKTLVWGLDKDYYDNREWIESNFDDLYYYDANEKKLPLYNAIKKEDLDNTLSEFDCILVAADPPSIIDLLVNQYKISLSKIKVLFYEILKYNAEEIKFFGESNEDAVIMLLLSRLGISLKDARYLEIGTNDPVRHNNSFSLYQNGARGVLVDAFPMVGVLSQIIRPEDKFINCAVSDKSGENVVFYACESSAYSSLDEEHHKQYENQRLNRVREISVPMIGINELINMCGFVPNVLLCDAEGFDERIVRGIEDYVFDIIMLETDHVDTDNDSLLNYMEEKGYKLFSRIKQNDIYYRIKR
ncbi:MAG: hypothetical protein IJ749_04380 [Eubacterium sp.]|nr:hypothetical protein [Eubacterium sp.]